MTFRQEHPVAYDPIEQDAGAVPYRKMDGFDVIEFLGYARARWRTALISSAVAVLLSAAVTWISPHRYTATASILIEPPAGNDPRGATAVSPIYLESLKTYEHFASADTLFAQALDHLGLRDTYKGESLQSLKNRVLRVSKLRDTKILEISATLKDPVKAQALAEYVARRSTELNRSLNDQSERDLSEQARRFAEAAASRLHRAEQARNEFMIQNPIVDLEDDRAAGLKLKSQIQSDLSYAKAELAQYEAQLARSLEGAPTPSPATLRQGIVSERANITALEEQARRLDQELTKNAALLERRKHERDRLDSELGSARAQFESASTKTNDILSSSAFRGERLDVIDPGVVPQRPSSPNLSLNVVLAFSVSILGWLLYVTVGFSYSRQLLARQASIYGAE